MSKITKSDYKYFEMARKEAEKSDFDNFHLGCILVYKKHIIGRGHNSTKTHPKQKEMNKYRHFNKSNKPVNHSLHAEIAALNSVPYSIAQNINWADVKVYIFRISKGRNLGMGLARPCAACRAALQSLGVRHFHYTGNDSFIYEEMF